MKLLVCGGRNFSDLELLDRSLTAVHRKHGIGLLIHGGATGADRLSGEWAERNGIHSARVDALWKSGGRAAGPERNRAMLVYLLPDAVVAFPGGRGTQNMISQAKAAGVAVWEPDQS